MKTIITIIIITIIGVGEEDVEKTGVTRGEKKGYNLALKFLIKFIFNQKFRFIIFQVLFLFCYSINSVL
jgi:hypothetical protein